MKPLGGTQQFRIVRVAMVVLLGFAGVLLQVGVTPARAQATTWSYSHVHAYTLPGEAQDYGQASFGTPQADVNGGSVRVTLQGPDICDGASAAFQYSWSFDRDISQLSSGETFNVNLHSSWSPPSGCGAVGGRASITASGCAGNLIPRNITDQDGSPATTISRSAAALTRRPTRPFAPYPTFLIGPNQRHLQHYGRAHERLLFPDRYLWQARIRL